MMAVPWTKAQSASKAQSNAYFNKCQKYNTLHNTIHDLERLSLVASLLRVLQHHLRQLLILCEHTLHLLQHHLRLLQRVDLLRVPLDRLFVLALALVLMFPLPLPFLLLFPVVLAVPTVASLRLLLRLLVLLLAVWL